MTSYFKRLSFMTHELWHKILFFFLSTEANIEATHPIMSARVTYYLVILKKFKFEIPAEDNLEEPSEIQLIDGVVNPLWVEFLLMYHPKVTVDYRYDVKKYRNGEGFIKV